MFHVEHSNHRPRYPRGRKGKQRLENGELYVFTESRDRIGSALSMKLGRAQSEVPAAWRLATVNVGKNSAAPLTRHLQLGQESRIPFRTLK